MRFASSLTAFTLVLSPLASIAIGACSSTSGGTPGAPDAGGADAAPFDAAPAPDDGGTDVDAEPPLHPEAKRVFVTHDAWPGDLMSRVPGATDGAAAADALCNQAATAAKLGGQWKAYLSGQGPGKKPYYASERLANIGPYYLVDRRTKVVDSFGKATSGSYVANDTVLEHGIDMDENGDPAAGDVWTGEGFNAFTTPLHCANDAELSWSVGAKPTQGSVGQTGDETVLWREAAGTYCSNTAHLYCFEQ